MADFLHKQLTLKAGDVVQVTLDQQANVLLLDTANFSNYKAGRNCNFYGGCAKVSPIELAAPHAGTWHLVIDLGGAGGQIKYSCQVISA